MVEVLLKGFREYLFSRPHGKEPSYLHIMYVSFSMRYQEDGEICFFTPASFHRSPFDSSPHSYL